MMSSSAGRPVGLRERKKARTRDTIQRHALQLFTTNGYTPTTVEQIAEAAEVSPSTFFRYFPTKEDAVLYDRLDPVLIEAFLRQPADLTSLRALRQAMRETFTQLSAEETEVEVSRQRLFWTEPALRSRMMERLVDTVGLVSDAVAEREGVERDDPRVSVFSGATFGVIVAVVFDHPAMSTEHPPSIMSDQLLTKIDAALEMLGGGVPFETDGR